MVLEWLADNREWLFSGAGLAVFSGLGLLRRRRDGPGDGASPTRDASVRGVKVRAGGNVTITTGDSTATAVNYLASEGSELRYVRGEILSPVDGSASGHHVAVSGRCSALPPGVDLWLMTQDLSYSDLYHPDDGPVAERDGRWMGRASIGNRQIGAHAGIAFKIYLVAANEEAGAKYRAYLERAHRNDAWPGIADLMGGRVVASIEVHRDDAHLLGE